jgi:hypothetical protein
MAITDAQVAALRAYLTQDPDEAERLNGRLRQTGDLEGYGTLVWAAFVLAVRRRFAPEWTVPDVVKYVADVRARWGRDEDDFDPRTAEILMRRALDDWLEADLDEMARGRAQIFLLSELIADNGLDEATGLDSFMAEARALGDQMINRMTRLGLP